MPPPKRRTKGGRPVHDGRVTRPEVPTPLPHPPVASGLGKRSEAVRRAASPPAPSRRYTPPTKSFRLRPGWHELLGFTLLFVGVALAVVNDVMMLQPSVTLLPGGHSELYLIVAIAIAGYSTWWFGWFDRRQ